MKFWLIFMCLWAISVTLYAIMATVILGKEIETKEAQLASKDRTNHILGCQLEGMERKVDDLIYILHDSHMRKVGFCSECSTPTYSKTLGCYLCLGEEKTEFDYCSDFDLKDGNIN